MSPERTTPRPHQVKHRPMRAPRLDRFRFGSSDRYSLVWVADAGAVDNSYIEIYIYL